MPIPESELETESPEIEVLRAALDSYTGQFGPNHPLVLDVTERLAVEYWREGTVGRAVNLLDTALQSFSDLDHPGRIDLLNVLWKIMFEQKAFEVAREILEEICGFSARQCGEEHPDTLSARGDLAIVLFYSRREDEAVALGLSALETARTRLGSKNRVTCVLAWNRALLCERRNDPETARTVAREDLLWLLAEDRDRLDPDLREIQEWLIDRFNWDAASVC